MHKHRHISVGHVHDAVTAHHRRFGTGEGRHHREHTTLQDTIVGPSHRIRPVDDHSHHVVVKGHDRARHTHTVTGQAHLIPTVTSQAHLNPTAKGQLHQQMSLANRSVQRSLMLTLQYDTQCGPHSVPADALGTDTLFLSANSRLLG